MKPHVGETPMFKNLDIFRMSYAMASHAGQKQAVAAQNIANSDTPGYKARDISDFSQAFEADKSLTDSAGLRSSRERHLNGAMPGQTADTFVDKTAIASPNGNTVSLETEMLRSLDAKRAHDRALAIYKSSITILRATLSRA